MKQVVIENPVVNSPFEELKRYIRLADERKKDKETRIITADTFWIPAGNTHGACGTRRTKFSLLCLRKRSNLSPPC